MKKATIVLFVLSVIVSGPSFAADSTSSTWEYLQQGPYEVGYVQMSCRVADSVLLINENFRRVDIAAWYPDVKKSKGLAKKQVPDKFPVILLCPGVDAKLDAYLTITRYLASHGFVVATFPSSGDAYTGGHPAYRANFRELQLEYLKIALARTTNLDFASKDKVGVMGHSYGGPAAINLALLGKNIDAVVSLDGTDACLDFTKQMADQFPYYNPANMTAPYMLVLAELSYCDGDKQSLEFYDGIVGAQAYVARFFNLEHGHFHFSLIVNPEPVAKRSFEIALLYVHNFFKANLYDDIKAKEWLSKSPQELGFPADLVDVRSKN